MKPAVLGRRELRRIAQASDEQPLCLLVTGVYPQSKAGGGRGMDEETERDD